MNSKQVIYHFYLKKNSFTYRKSEESILFKTQLDSSIANLEEYKKNAESLSSELKETKKRLEEVEESLDFDKKINMQSFALERFQSIINWKNQRSKLNR